MADETAAATGSVRPDDEITPRRRVNMMVAAWIIGLGLVAGAGIYFSFKFVESQRAIALQEWQIKLGIVADSRVADVNNWIANGVDTIAELTENQSVQLYMSELAEAGDPSKVPDGTASIGYLLNFLVAMAERNGFTPPPALQETNSNLERPGVAGIALTDAKGNGIVATPGMPALTAKLKVAVEKAAAGETAFIDIFKGATNQPTLGFALPVYGIQDVGGDESLGVALGLRVISDELFRLLKQPGDTTKTSEIYIVRMAENTVEYLSPLKDGARPLERALALDTPDLAAAFALEKPGGFGIKKNYAGEEVLVTSRPIADLPWVLIRTITREEALAANEERQRNILIVFILIIVGVAVGMIAIWRHGTSLRAEAAAEKFRISSERFENISKFMRVVTDSQPTAIVAVDGETIYTFANDRAAELAGISVDDMMGKTMAAVMGPVRAKHFADINKWVLEEFAEAEAEGIPDSVQQCRQSHVERFDLEDGDFQVIKSDHIPLRGDRDHPPGILMILDDITEFSREQMVSEARLRHLVGTLINVVDRHDAGASLHSTRVAEVARALAKEMRCDRVESETAEFAGNLRGLGKIYVPPDVLAKSPDELTDEERHQLETIYLTSASLLENDEFEGPVVEVVRQSGEHVDGTGPLGLSGEEIQLVARIVAVADEFVSLVQARDRQEGMTFEDASMFIFEQSGKRFDRRVVTALLNLIENHGGAEAWQHYRNIPEAAGI